MIIPTVKIEAESELGYIIINESDFDEKTQTIFVEPDAGTDADADKSDKKAKK